MTDHEETVRIMDPPIDTGVKVSTVIQAVSSAQQGVVKLQSWTANKVGIGLGFLSHIIRMDLNWVPQGEQLPQSVILKAFTLDTVLSMSEKMKGDGIDVNHDSSSLGAFSMVHHTECDFYDAIPKGNLSIPRCYLASKSNPTTLIMEDFSESGITVDLAEGLTLEQTYSAVEALAAIHQYSYCNNRWKHSELIRSSQQQMLDGMGPDFFANTSAIAAAAKAEFADYFDPIADRFLEIQTDVNDLKTAQKLHEQLGVQPLLVHGDLWISNILFDRANENRVLAIIDWQACHPGFPAEDLGKLLCTSLSSELRKASTKDILRRYYESFSKRLQEWSEKNERMEMPFSMEQLCDGFEQLFGYSTFLSTSVLIVFARRCEGKDEESLRKRNHLLNRARDLIIECLAKIDA